MAYNAGPSVSHSKQHKHSATRGQAVTALLKSVHYAYLLLCQHFEQFWLHFRGHRRHRGERCDRGARHWCVRAAALRVLTQINRLGCVQTRGNTCNTVAQRCCNACAIPNASRRMRRVVENVRTGHEQSITDSNCVLAKPLNNRINFSHKNLKQIHMHTPDAMPAASAAASACSSSSSSSSSDSDSDCNGKGSINSHIQK